MTAPDTDDIIPPRDPADFGRRRGRGVTIAAVSALVVISVALGFGAGQFADRFKAPKAVPAPAIAPVAPPTLEPAPIARPSVPLPPVITSLRGDSTSAGMTIGVAGGVKKRSGRCHHPCSSSTG